MFITVFITACHLSQSPNTGTLSTTSQSSVTKLCSIKYARNDESCGKTMSRHPHSLTNILCERVVFKNTFHFEDYMPSMTDILNTGMMNWWTVENQGQAHG